MIPKLLRSLVREDPKTGCWVWNGHTSTSGYGTVNPRRHEGHRVAHRWSYATFVGPIPEGLFICHHCDNPPCVRPSHLYAGTALDNARDAQRRSRNGWCVRKFGVSYAYYRRTIDKQRLAALLSAHEAQENLRHMAQNKADQEAAGKPFQFKKGDKIPILCAYCGMVFVYVCKGSGRLPKLCGEGSVNNCRADPEARYYTRGV